jgi:hypothetical protein
VKQPVKLEDQIEAIGRARAVDFLLAYMPLAGLCPFFEDIFLNQ